MFEVVLKEADEDEFVVVFKGDVTLLLLLLFEPQTKKLLLLLLF